MARAKTRAKNKSRARKKLRVAFIGAGGRALMAHYPSLRDIPEGRTSRCRRARRTAPAQNL